MPPLPNDIPSLVALLKVRGCVLIARMAVWHDELCATIPCGPPSMQADSKMARPEVGRAEAALALAKLAPLGEVECAQIVKAGALQPLVLLMKDGSEEGKVHTAIVLGNLSYNSVERSVQIVNAGALQPLVMLLEEGSEKCKEAAASALGNLAADSEDRS